MRHHENEEIVQEIQKIRIPRSSYKNCFRVGDIVKWLYESEDDLQYGTLYIVVGFNAEKSDIVVTRIMGKPYEVKEFHISQLALA